ncbi:small heat shock protein [Thelephora ganbajun]|uniref:Small heat shock protein n=1 Tax=Thelephora ganbajun TaxID=370292 RepID=A0ACB6ZB76_THEGA|nr:small heat shock protein [Thelephora ganbajun]
MSLNRFYGLPSDLDQLLEDPFTRTRGRHPLVPFEETHTSRMMSPRMDLHESSDKNVMTATFELPGLPKDKVHLNVENGFLVVSGDTSQSSEQQEQGYAIKERTFGRFVRSVKLPDGTKREDVKARMENGVLTVTYPKSSPGRESQRITIK